MKDKDANTYNYTPGADAGIRSKGAHLPSSSSKSFIFLFISFFSLFISLLPPSNFHGILGVGRGS